MSSFDVDGVNLVLPAGRLRALPPMVTIFLSDEIFSFAARNRKGPAMPSRKSGRPDLTVGPGPLLRPTVRKKAMLEERQLPVGKETVKSVGRPIRSIIGLSHHSRIGTSGCINSWPAEI